MKTNNLIFMLIIFLAAFMLRFGFLYTQEVIATDGVRYIQLAKDFSALNSLSGNISNTQLGYPSLIKIAHIAIQDWESAAKTISLLFGSFLVILTFIIGRKLFCTTTGIIGALFVAFEPNLISSSSQVMTEATHAFFLTSAIFVLWLAIKNTRRAQFFTAGALFGLAYFIRVESLLLFFIGIIVTCLTYCFIGNIPFARYAKSIAWFTLGFCLLFSLYQALAAKPSVKCSILQSRIYCTLDKIIYPGTEPALDKIYQEPNGEASGLDTLYYKTLEKKYKGKVLSYVREYYPKIIKYYLRDLYYRIYSENFPRMFQPVMIIFFGLGLFSRTKKTEAEFAIFSSVFILLSILMYSVDIGWDMRRILCFLPLALLWVANGVIATADWFHNNFNFYKRPVLVFGVCLVLANFAPRLVAPFCENDEFQNYPIELKETGLWIKEHLPGDFAIMSRCPEVAYYANKQLSAFPDMQYYDLIKYLKLSPAEYLVIDKRWTVRLYPQLSYLLEEKDAPKELKPVYRWDKKPEYKVVVYKIIQ